MVPDDGGDTGPARSLEARGVLDVRDDDRDLTPELTPLLSVDERLEIGPATTDENTEFRQRRLRSPETSLKPQRGQVV
jgi:hypothetical protein